MDSTVYIVEDDDNIREMESYALKNSGFSVSSFPTAAPFWAAVGDSLPDIVVLDVMLTGEDGTSILRKLKGNRDTRHIPVLLVTAKTAEVDAVRGLESGADDYIKKPFGVMEFVARVKAASRRFAAKPDEEQKILSLGGITLDDGRRIVTVDGERVTLTYKEYELLKFFLRNTGVVFSRDTILDRVWNAEYEGGTRTVDMHVTTLRKKLGRCAGYIKTIRNVGYSAEEE